MVDIPQNFSSKRAAKKEISDFSSRHGQGAQGDFIEEPFVVTPVLTRSESGQRLLPYASTMASPSTQYMDAGVMSGMVPFLRSIREPLAEYQERKGISRNQNFSFFALITAVTQYIYAVICSIGLMVYNLFPIIDAFLLILRFILDKGIDCLQSQSSERYIKTAVFFVEFIAIVILVLAISGLILVPLSVLFGHVFHKIWNAVFQ